MIKEKQIYFYDYCELEECIVQFVTCIDGFRTTCCSCSYSKNIKDSKLNQTSPPEPRKVLRGRYFYV